MSYALWKREKANPTPEERRGDRPTEPLDLLGYWRIATDAHTKPDYPLGIWTKKDEATGEYVEPVIFQIGRKHPMNTAEHRYEWDELMAGSWLKCIAVPKEDWDLALETGRWPDGKPARVFKKEELAGIATMPDTPTQAGDDYAGEDDGGAEDAADLLQRALVAVNTAPDEVYEQVKANLAAANDDAKKLPPITTMEAATAAAAIIERIANNGSIGEERRKAEKKPWDDGARAVQEKWVPVLQPASDTAKDLKTKVQRFRDAEAERLRKEEADRREAERQRIENERLEELRQEAERQALATGEPVADEEALKAQAESEAAAEVEQMPTVDTTVRVGTAYGKGVAMPKKKVGVIDDVDAFIAALRPEGAFADWPESNDFKAWLQDKASKLARANTAIAGMRIEKV